MKLGAFSVSLSVKDIQKSKEFYTALGFDVVGGEQSQNWLILRNGEHTIGLFQGMFEGNIMTFNPGWDSQCKPLESYTDIRELLKVFQRQGIETSPTSIDEETGPASISLKDPDGNSILIDQHI